MTELIAEGRHRALIHTSEEALRFGITGEGDDEKEQVVVLFDLVGENDPDFGRTITWFGFLNEKNFDRTIEALRFCGWEGNDFVELPQLVALGRLATEVELVIEHETYGDRRQAKVRWVNRAGGGVVKLKRPLDGPALAAFSARMRSRVAVAGDPNAGRIPRPTQQQLATGTKPQQPAGTKPRSGGGAPHPNAPGGDLDDIPFISSAGVW